MNINTMNILLTLELVSDRYISYFGQNQEKVTYCVLHYQMHIKILHNYSVLSPEYF